MSELMCLVKEYSVNPTHCSRIRDNKISLTVIDENRDTFVEQKLNSIDLSLHEVGVKMIVDILGMLVEDYFRIESVYACSYLLISEIRSKQI